MAPKSVPMARVATVAPARPGLTKVLYEEGCYESYFNRICVPRCHNPKHPMTDQQIYNCMEDCVVEASLACNPPEE